MDNYLDDVKTLEPKKFTVPFEEETNIIIGNEGIFIAAFMTKKGACYACVFDMFGNSNCERIEPDETVNEIWLHLVIGQGETLVKFVCKLHPEEEKMDVLVYAL